MRLTWWSASRAMGDDDNAVAEESNEPDATG